MHKSTYILFLATLFLFTQCQESAATAEAAEEAVSKIEEKPVRKPAPIEVKQEEQIAPPKVVETKVPQKEAIKEVTTKKVVAKAEEATDRKKKPAPVKKKKRAKIEFGETTHKFGTIKTGDKVQHKFKFKNTGSAPLVIKNVDVSCGCTFPSYPFLPIKPGEDGEIDVTFDSKNKIGRQKPTITVVTNGRPRTLKLHLEGFVE